MDTNFLYANRFKLILPRAPNLEFMLTDFTIPDIALSPATQPTPITVINHPGDQIDFTALNIGFNLQESLSGYMELFNWMMDTSMLRESNRKTLINDKKLTTDIIISILDSSYNPKQNVIFYDAFPIHLTGWRFDSKITEPQPIMTSASFAYTYFDYERVI